MVGVRVEMIAVGVGGCSTEKRPLTGLLVAIVNIIRVIVEKIKTLLRTGISHKESY